MKVILIAFFVATINSCSSGKTIISGKAYLINRIYDPDKNEYVNSDFFPCLKVWFRDSLVIEEIKRIERHSNNGTESITAPINHYKFIDLRTRNVFEYGSFSDTATLINKAALPDSIPLSEGWSFWIPKIFRTENSKLKDTTIDGVSFSKLDLNLDLKDTTLKYKGYLRCDTKTKIFNLGIIQNYDTGCILFRLDAVETPLKHPVSTEIKFISSQLSKEEIKVFDIWEKNAKGMW